MRYRPYQFRKSSNKFSLSQVKRIVSDPALTWANNAPITLLTVDCTFLKNSIFTRVGSTVDLTRSAVTFSQPDEPMGLDCIAEKYNQFIVTAVDVQVKIIPDTLSGTNVQDYYVGGFVTTQTDDDFNSDLARELQAPRSRLRYMANGANDKGPNTKVMKWHVVPRQYKPVPENRLGSIDHNAAGDVTGMTNPSDKVTLVFGMYNLDAGVALDTNPQSVTLVVTTQYYVRFASPEERFQENIV